MTYTRLSLITLSLSTLLGFPATAIAGLPDGVSFWWTALGDSYASGVGAGAYTGGQRCLRYDRAYPQLMQADKKLGHGEDQIKRKLQNVACSGAGIEDVAQCQMVDEDSCERPKFGEPSVATLHVGADDIDFPGILFNCILDAHIWGGSNFRTCEDQRAHSWKLIYEYKPDLINRTRELIDEIIVKAEAGQAGSNFKLYVLGYGQPFNVDTDFCDNVTFARNANPKPDGKTHTKMTKEVRKDINAMFAALSATILNAVNLYASKAVDLYPFNSTDFYASLAAGGYASDTVKFIDIDIGLDGHRFCEDGVHEPNEQNPNLWFFHYPYSQEFNASASDNMEFGNLIDGANARVFGNLSVADIGKKYNNTRSVTDAWFDAIDAYVIPGGPEAPDFWRALGDRAKLFHPQIAYHQWIENEVLQAWKNDQNAGSGTSPGGGNPENSGAGPGKEDPADGQLNCTGNAKNFFVGRDDMNTGINAYCGQSQSRKSLIDNNSRYGVTFGIVIVWTGVNKTWPSSDDCKQAMTRIMDSCDALDPNNPLNWKYGGTLTHGPFMYSISPRVDQGYKPGECSFRLQEDTEWDGYDWTNMKHIRRFFVERLQMFGGDGREIVGRAGFYNNTGDGWKQECWEDKGCGWPTALPDMLYITPKVIDDNKDDVLEFAIGSQIWNTSVAKGPQRCETGGYNDGFSGNNRKMRCFFQC